MTPEAKNSHLTFLEEDISLLLRLIFCLLLLQHFSYQTGRWTDCQYSCQPKCVCVCVWVYFREIERTPHPLHQKHSAADLGPPCQVVAQFPWQLPLPVSWPLSGRCQQPCHMETRRQGRGSEGEAERWSTERVKVVVLVTGSSFQTCELAACVSVCGSPVNRHLSHRCC